MKSVYWHAGGGSGEGSPRFADAYNDSSSSTNVVIDHKSFPGGMELAREKASDFWGQLDAYARALGGVVGTWIHLPVLGAVMEIEVGG